MGFRVSAIAYMTLAFVLSGCSTFNIKRGVSDDDLASTKRVGVVSVLGDKFQGVYVGTTVFTNKSFFAPVPEWGIDRTAREETLVLLKKNTRFEAAAVDLGGLSVDEILENEGAALWKAAEQQKFDRLVILSPGVSDNYRNAHSGYGYYEKSFFGSSDKCIYAAYIVYVYDVASKKPIAWEWGGGGPCVHKYEGELKFKDAFDKYSAEEKSALKTEVESNIKDGMVYSLKKLYLLPDKSEK